MAAASPRTPQAPPEQKHPWRVEGHKQEPQQPQRTMPPARSRFWWAVIAILALNIILSFALSPKPSRPSVPYTLFFKQVQTGNVAEISSKGEEIQGTFKKEITYPTGKDAKQVTKFQTVRPEFGDDGLTQALLKQNVPVNAHKVDTGTPLWQPLLFGFGPTLLLVGLFIALARRSSAGGMLGSFGRSTAKRYEHSADRTTFQDVAGVDEAEDELNDDV